MAAGEVQNPGSKYGPCRNECTHIDCKGLREIANSTCRLCKAPIGYENAFYLDDEHVPPTPFDDSVAFKPRYVHALCFEESIEEGSKN